MRARIYTAAALIGVTMLIGGAAKMQFRAGKPLYLDSSQPIEDRVEDLLHRMTLEEKVGQMNMPCVYLQQLGADVSSKLAACKRLAEGTWSKEIGPVGGFFTLANTILHGGPGQQIEQFNELQKIAIGKTRLGVPLLQTEEGTHGLMCSGGTIFPEGPAIGSTWNMDLVRELYSVAAREARAVGIHQLFTLVIEPVRDPRLGRNQEGFSEDPYLCSRIAEAVVRGAQGDDVSGRDKVVAGLCHFPGQSEGAGGLEQGAMEVSERTLREIFLPPWVAGIKQAGALGVMATYPSIDGTPAHASRKLLTRILREELSFQGLVLSEGNGIDTIVSERVAPTQREAGAIAVRAGVDVGITLEAAYMRFLVQNAAEGKVPEEFVDRAVRRILRQKLVLGLFERPYVDASRQAEVHTAAAQALAHRAAREGIVLLKNERRLLPLDRSVRSIAVIGPNADSARNQLGDYVSLAISQEIVTVLEGIRRKASATTRVVYARGCDVLGADQTGFAEAREAARGADVAIVVVGENERKAPGGAGTNGEGRDVASLDLTGVQEELIAAVVETGTPTVVVLINGRPLSTRWTVEHVPAIVEAWLPGERGGDAVADVLFGDYNPSGRLPVTVPRHVGQLPVYYNFKSSKVAKKYVDMPAEPLYEFGYGLSYTRFRYSNLQIAPREIGPADRVQIRADVTNTGDRWGEEVVQLYIRDEISSVARPVKELKGFQKVALSPGETKSLSFTLGPDELSFLDETLERVVEPGDFAVMVGASSADIRLKGNFAVRDHKR